MSSYASLCSVNVSLGTIIALVSLELIASQTGPSAPNGTPDYPTEYVCANGECVSVGHLQLQTFRYTTMQSCMELSRCGPNKWFCQSTNGRGCISCNASNNECPLGMKLYDTPHECDLQESCHPECGDNMKWTRYYQCHPTGCNASTFQICRNEPPARGDIQPGCVCDETDRRIYRNGRCVIFEDCPKESAIWSNYAGKRLSLNPDLRFHCDGTNGQRECSFCNIGRGDCPEGVELYESSDHCHRQTLCQPRCGANKTWTDNYACDKSVCGEYHHNRTACDDVPKESGCVCNSGLYLLQGVCVPIETCFGSQAVVPKFHEAEVVKEWIEYFLKKHDSCDDLYDDCATIPEEARCRRHLRGCLATCGCCRRVSDTKSVKSKLCLEKAKNNECNTNPAFMNANCLAHCCQYRLVMHSTVADSVLFDDSVLESD